MISILYIFYLLISVANCVTYKRVCYYTNWAQYRGGLAKYDITLHYKTGLCTHIIYAFAKVELIATNSFSIVPYEWNDQSVGYIKVNFIFLVQNSTTAI